MQHNSSILILIESRSERMNPKRHAREAALLGVCKSIDVS